MLKMVLFLAQKLLISAQNPVKSPMLLASRALSLSSGVLFPLPGLISECQECAGLLRRVVLPTGFKPVCTSGYPIFHPFFSLRRKVSARRGIPF